MIPKVTIILKIKGKEYRMIGTADKIKRKFTSNFMKRAQKHQFDKGYIKVKYTKDFLNEMELKNYEDIKWAREAFLDESLYL